MKRTLLPAMTLLVGLATGGAALAQQPPVYVVVFTHIEDNTPGGPLGSAPSRQNYLVLRSRLIAMADSALATGVPWTLQPDWKILEAALLYEDSTLRATTGGKNFLRFLREDRAVSIDPHSHENGGYNYTDVAHLLDSLGVGGSSVIGGHVWDPSYPEFQEWDRFRVPVAGQRYPAALWRGDLLIGSGTPNHVNDPVISGVWRPRDRDHYFEHDPAGNIDAVGQWKKSVASIGELIALYRDGVVPPTAMLTFSCNVGPSAINAPGGLAAIRDTVLAPIAAWRDSGLVLPTDFRSLIEAWVSDFGAQSYLYEEVPAVRVAPAPAPAAGLALAPARPNPVRGEAWWHYALDRAADIRLAIYDVAGRRVSVLAEGRMEAGAHAVRWDPTKLAAGVYVCRLEVAPAAAGVSATRVTRRAVVVR